MERFRRLGVHQDAHRNGAWCVVQSPQTPACSFATGGADGAVALWSLRSGAETAAAVIGDSDEAAGDVNGGGKGAGTDARGVKADSLSPVVAVATMKHHALGVVGVAVATGATVGASTSLDGTLKIWDAARPDVAARPVSAMSGNITEVWAVAISADGARVVTAGAAGAVQVVDAAMALSENSFNYDPDAAAGDAPMCLSLALSPDGARLAVGAQDGSVRLFDVETGAPVTRRMDGHSGPVRSVAFVPGEASIVTCADDGLVNYYDAESAALAISLRGHAGMVLSAAPSPCGKYVATGSSDRKLKVWDRKLREQVFTSSEHTDSVWGVAYVADGKRIVSVADDASIGVVDCEHADVVVA
jgi:WD40 repeat protein